MADVHSKEIRSKNMAAIKSKNTKPEMLVRRFLHANGYRYKLNDKAPGKPGKRYTVLYYLIKVTVPFTC
jgi:DNA mismatch endonuclease (patch repair protein)